MLEWARFGGWGLALAGATFVVPWVLRRELDADPRGTPADPLPPLHQTPAEGNYREPVGRKVPVEAVAAVWARRLGPEMGGRQAVGVLVAHAATANGAELGAPVLEVVNHNLLRRRAGRFFPGPWTATPAAEWKGLRPVFRWAPIRSYLSLDAAASSWLADLPEGALAAVRAGDPAAYYGALTEAGWTPPGEGWMPEIVAAYRVFVESPGEVPTGPSPR